MENNITKKSITYKINIELLNAIDFKIAKEVIEGKEKRARGEIIEDAIRNFLSDNFEDEKNSVNLKKDSERKSSTYNIDIMLLKAIDMRIAEDIIKGIGKKTKREFIESALKSFLYMELIEIERK